MFFATKAETDKMNKSNFVFKRKITDQNLKEFNEHLLSVDWNDVLKNTNPNSVYDEFLKRFMPLYDSDFPVKKIQIKLKNLASPWITKGILKSSKRKQKLYERFLKRRTPLNELNYKNFKRIFESTKQKSKPNYFKERLDKYKNGVIIKHGVPHGLPHMGYSMGYPKIFYRPDFKLFVILSV